MISRNEIKSNSAREAKIAEEIEFNFCIALEARMVQFGSVAVHNHAIELCNDRLKRTRAACSAWTSKMKVAQNERTRHRRRRVIGDVPET
jgi:hypothetical protein